MDVNCGYIAIASGSGTGECAEDDVESELNWIYRKYFFGIFNFERYFMIVWFITQLLYFYNDTLKNNKLNKKDYLIISLLGSVFSALVYRYVFQDYKLLENLTAYDNIRLLLEISKKQYSEKEIMSLSEQIGIQDILKTKCSQLSEERSKG